MQAQTLNILAIAVGNTRSRLGLFSDKELLDPVSIDNANLSAQLKLIAALKERHPAASLVIASVNNDHADKLERELAASQSISDIWRIGRDVPINLTHTLQNDQTVGLDRLLNAVAAHTRAEQACIIVDAGTAITVDFIDGQGVFHGGAIAPGAQMMLNALHNHTASLPQLNANDINADLPPMGKDTPTAMLLGVRSAIRGMVHELLDRYASFYDAYPRVIATGGDALRLLKGDDLIENIVPDLQLIGIQVVCDLALSDQDSSQDPATS